MPSKVKVSKPEVKVLAGPVPNWSERRLKLLGSSSGLEQVQEVKSESVGARQGVAVLVEAGLGVGVDEVEVPLAQRQRHLIEPQVPVALAEAGAVGGFVGWRDVGIEVALGAVADPRQRQLPEGQLDVFDAPAAAAEVAEEEIIDVNVRAAHRSGCRPRTSSRAGWPTTLPMEAQASGTAKSVPALELYAVYGL